MRQHFLIVEPKEAGALEFAIWIMMDMKTLSCFVDVHKTPTSQFVRSTESFLPPLELMTSNPASTFDSRLATLSTGAFYSTMLAYLACTALNDTYCSWRNGYYTHCNNIGKEYTGGVVIKVFLFPYAPIKKDYIKKSFVFILSDFFITNFDRFPYWNVDL